MTRLKTKELRKMSKEDRMKKTEEMKFEMAKSKGNAVKGATRPREIRKIIARILTLNNEENKNSKVSSEQVRASSVKNAGREDNK
jgi:ribosomal protein L29